MCLCVCLCESVLSLYIYIHVCVCGWVLQDRQELTPVAIRAGKLLAHRLYNGASTHMDYDRVRTQQHQMHLPVYKHPKP